MGFHTPLLLIVWRRPFALRHVINAIRPLAPSQLFIACDGPNLHNVEEAEKVLATRQIIASEIDWPCNIERLYSDVNQGCSVGPINAISWFYSHVEAGIILEDDCVPHPDFLPFSEVLLERYRDDERIWCICGNNFQAGHWRGLGSYYFSRIPLIWGWATWRRCWDNYDQHLISWPSFKSQDLLASIFADPLVANYWSSKWDSTIACEEVTWWDYQWIYTCISNSGLCIHPNVNLVQNIGSGADATHTTGYIIPTDIGPSLGPIAHPEFVVQDNAADALLFDRVYGGLALRRNRTLPYRIKHRLMRLADLLRLHLSSCVSILP